MPLWEKQWIKHASVQTLRFIYRNVYTCQVHPGRRIRRRCNCYLNETIRPLTDSHCPVPAKACLYSWPFSDTPFSWNYSESRAFSTPLSVRNRLFNLLLILNQFNYLLYTLYSSGTILLKFISTAGSSKKMLLPAGSATVRKLRTLPAFIHFTRLRKYTLLFLPIYENTLHTLPACIGVAGLGRACQCPI